MQSRKSRRSTARPGLAKRPSPPRLPGGLLGKPGDKSGHGPAELRSPTQRKDRHQPPAADCARGALHLASSDCIHCTLKNAPENAMFFHSSYDRSGKKQTCAVRERRAVSRLHRVRYANPRTSNLSRWRTFRGTRPGASHGASQEFFFGSKHQYLHRWRCCGRFLLGFKSRGAPDATRGG